MIVYIYIADKIMALEQQNEKVPQERTIEDKINDPKTSWGELTKIRDQLQKDIKDGETELKQLEIGISTLLQSA
jgi:septal ring factor EnvC (AmiA/AmiB activator)